MNQAPSAGLFSYNGRYGQLVIRAAFPSGLQNEIH